MTFRLDANNCAYQDDSFEVPMIEFTCYFNDHRLFTMQPEMGSNEWMALADACKNGTRASEDWAPCNGEANIYVAKGVAAFQIAKYGDGCGGSLTISVPAKLDKFMSKSQTILIQ
jgi:hypothetical protein